jgi:hypothetical protein
MSLRSQLEVHALACRLAVLKGNPLPAWDGGSLAYARLAGLTLFWVNLPGVDLSGAALSGSFLSCADLSGADLSGADLSNAKMAGVNLTAATMPDGRKWEAYRADPLAGICPTPRARAVARKAWGEHTWGHCPMHAALGIHGLGDLLDADLRRRVACFVACYDAGLLPVPGEEER